MFQGLVLLAVLVIPGLAIAQDDVVVTVDHALRFGVGTPKMRSALSRTPSVADLVKGEFGIGVEDLNGDGSGEIIILGGPLATCVRSECPLIVLEKQGEGKITEIMSQRVVGPLGVTKEQVGGFRALVSLDASGKVAMDARANSPTRGKPLVYAMQSPSASTANDTATNPAGTVSAGASAVSAPEPSSASIRASGTRPDVLGIKVGVSNSVEAKATLAQITPPLNIKEGYTQLIGMAAQNRGIAQQVEVKGGNFLSHLEGATRACNAANMNCEEFFIFLSGPPSAGTTFAIRRTIRFSDGPSIDTITKSLTEKYGPPGYMRNYGGNGVQFDFAWAWTTDGKTLTMKEGHPCTLPNAARMSSTANGQVEQAALYLKEGCAVVAHAILGAKNGVVNSMSVELADQEGIRATSSRTLDFVTRFIKEFEQGERDAAAKKPAPKM